jgi:hypothetical protein
MTPVHCAPCPQRSHQGASFPHCVQSSVLAPCLQQDSESDRKGLSLEPKRKMDPT